MSEWKTVDEERQARQEVVQDVLKVYRYLLPTLLKRLGKIRDPRNPKTVKHKSTVLMLYGILAFVFQMSSRREANRQMTMPMFRENLRLMFPELESVAHQDTLNRLLSSIDVAEIEGTLVELVQRFIRKKKFCRYLISQHYPVAMDGSQKLVRDWCGAEQWLERKVQCTEEDGTAGTRPQYYVYVLEASLAFADGMTIPLMSEFLDYTEGDQQRNKQDCELKAFRRLAGRLKNCFPRLPFLVLLDGLYPNGPVMQLCRQYHWQYMIVLQDDSLPSVWEEFEGLGKVQLANHLEQTWGKRRQRFRWVNDIEYEYGDDRRKRQILHVVVCQETWEEIDSETALVVQKQSRHAWISSEPLSRQNVHERCNLGARHRWGIESSFLVEKRQGYQYEHCFSLNWNAMRGYHFLMRIAHLINILAQRTGCLARLILRTGVRGMIRFLVETCSGPWLDADSIRALLALPCQLRLE
jgi:DDE_Tnp_1-associated